MAAAALLLAAPLVAFTGGTDTVAAVAPITLSTAGDYSVLAASTVTNSGPSTLAQNVGVSPGTAVTGFPPGGYTGALHVGVGEAGQAKTDLTLAYVEAAGLPISATTAADLSGLTLVGGVYATDSKGALGLTGPLVLDAQGDPNAVFVFQTDSTLITASSSSVELINGAQECNVFWQVGSSATLGTNSTFTGNIMALTSITVTTGATIAGRALARNGAVTLDDNAITAPLCDLTPAPVIVPTVGLATSSDYSLLAGSSATNTGPTTLAQNLGVSPGAAIVGFTPGSVAGETHAGDAEAGQAHTDLMAAWNDADGRPTNVTTTSDLGGLTLLGGVHAAPGKGPLSLTGSLVLDAQGNPDAVFIFQTDSTLATGPASTVTLINGAKANNVFWQVGSSATVGADSTFRGTIMAVTSIAVDNGATVVGRVLTRDGAVTLDSNAITDSSGETTTTATTTTGPTQTTGIGNPSSTLPAPGVNVGTELPRTGSDTSNLPSVALLFVLAGLGIVLVARRPATRAR